MSINYALKKLFDTVEHKLERIPQKVRALDKLRLYITGKEKPSRETLDRISLLVGFQDWESFKEALHGKTDGQENYED
ncbi:hypothetical protein [uncultured Prevotella sp.]|uniref:hypothetical protein n=1 Tax=uncultured Prevotella sp. TaxID=159272 RepID=UPI002632E568|nr:hypothetical protein [uncultured Prevotella sp.]